MTSYRNLSSALRKITQAIKLVNSFCPHTIAKLHEAHKYLSVSIKNHKNLTNYRPKKKVEVSLKSLTKELDGWFSKHIRLTHSNQRGHCICISCRKPALDWKQVDCGHYIKRQYTMLRWNENNCRPQCKHCNNFLQGNDVKFRAALVKELGENQVFYLELNKKKRRYTRQELQFKITYYKGKVEDMLK